MSAIAPQTTPQRTLPNLFVRFVALWRRRETIRFLTGASLKSGHRDKVLGHLWNLLDPLMFMLVYYFVFGIVFNLAAGGGGRSAEFMLYIFAGLLAYRFIAGAITESANCIRANRGLIHEINFPKAIFPTAVVFSRVYDYIWGMVVLFIFLLMARTWPTVHYVWLPVILLTMMVFTAGMTYLTACVGGFYADTQNVVQVVMRLLFYCSPVFWFLRGDGGHKAMIKNELVRGIFLMNPLACFFEMTRDILLWQRAPEMWMLVYVAVVSVIVFIAGFAVFTRWEGRFAKYV